MKMTFEFKNEELWNLANELAQYLNEKVQLHAKYHLTNLHDKLSGMLKGYNAVRQDVIKELDPTGQGIQNFILKDGKPIKNPAFEQFEEKMKETNEERQSFDFRQLPFSMLYAGESVNNYPSVFKLHLPPEEKD